MKILFCTKKDVLGAWILNWILPKLSQHHVKVFLSDKTRPVENSVQALSEEKFLERDLPLLVLFPLIDGHSKIGSLATFEGCRQRYQVEIDTVSNINDAGTEKIIRDWAPDIIVSARFSLIFKANVESIPTLGIFNVHPGTLPGYAGLFAPLRAILNAEKKLGCTLHKVDRGIDTGPIYNLSYLEANPEQSVFSHIAPLYELGLKSLLQLLADLAEGHPPLLREQDKNSFRYFSLPDEQSFDQLRHMGVEPVSYDFYSDFVKKFVPDGLTSKFNIALAPSAIQHSIQSISKIGIPATLKQFNESFEIREA